MWTLPNILTIARILAVMPLVACIGAGNWTAAFWIFIAAAQTDFLDGWIARRWKLTSEFGRFLDPLADKLIVAGALIALVGQHLAIAVTPAWLVTTILAREIAVSGLREYLGPKGIVVHVSKVAKWKTALQLTALAAILAGLALLDRETALLARVLMASGRTMLWIAALLAWISAWGYFRAALPAMRGQ